MTATRFDNFQKVVKSKQIDVMVYHLYGLTRFDNFIKVIQSLVL